MSSVENDGQHEITKDENGRTILRVSNGTNIHRLASAIFGYSKDGHEIALVCVGAAAVNQGIKSITKLNQLAAPCGEYFVVLPVMQIKQVEDHVSRSILKLVLLKRITGNG